MSIKMKGLLKGLRYISQIFDPKEQEMQIGFPTDVKHVAHIGWDSPNMNSPSWMNEFRSAPLSTGGDDAMADQTPPRYASNDMDDQASSKPAPAPRHSRRNKSATAIPMDSPSREHIPHRRHGNSSAFGAIGDVPILDMPSIPKIARKKKTKKEGSTRARMKPHAAVSDVGETGETMAAMRSPPPAEVVV